MELDLNTNGNNIRNSINSLSNGKLSWVLLGYHNNRTIEVVETGDDSLEDMFEEFHGSKIMYGFAAVTDPNTKLKKNVFINWQGSGAANSLKTASLQHSVSIKALCRPIHVTIEARNEDDLDLQEIMRKVAAASGSNYSFHHQDKNTYESKNIIRSENNNADSNRKARQKELSQLGQSFQEKETRISQSSTTPNYNSQPTKVGTNYQKINPAAEIENLRQVNKVEPSYPLKKEPARKPMVALPSSTQSKPAKVGTNYQKINPAAEIENLRQANKVEFESKPIIKSENNTAEQEKLKRNQELEILKNRRYDGESVTVGSSYKKIDPLEEIKRLKSVAPYESQSTNVMNSYSTQYKKINPMEDIQNLRRMSNNTVDEAPVVTNEPSGTNYQKINPLDEIKQARSQQPIIATSEPIANQQRQPEQHVIKTNVSSARQAFNQHPTNQSEPEKKSVSSSVSSYTSSNVTTPPPQLLAQVVKQPEAVVRPPPPQPVFAQPEPVRPAPPQPVFAQPEPVRPTPPPIQPTPEPEPVQPSPPPNVHTPSKEVEGGCARSLYDYEAQDNDEISFDVGELIRAIDRVDDGWWVGTNEKGQRGMFPSNYVTLEESQPQQQQYEPEPEVFVEPQETFQEPPVDSSYRPVVVDEGLKVRALYDYFAQDDDELTFKEGETIYNVTKVDDGWWTGETIKGDSGLFPANYVEEL